MTVATEAKPSLSQLREKYRDANVLDWDKSQRDDRFMIQIMAACLHSKSNVIDIGANLGHVILQIVKLAPHGQHYAFEPIPDLADRLRKNYPNVKVNEIALSDKEGEVSFNYCVEKPGWSSFKNWGKLPEAETKKITVQMRRLDDYLPKDYRVDFIKLDVEGAELQVLRGAQGRLKRYQPPVFFEHGCGAADAFGTTPEMIWDFFNKDCNYRVYNLRRWLGRGRPYSREQFGRAFRDHHAWNFLAVPSNAHAPSELVLAFKRIVRGLQDKMNHARNSPSA